MFPIEFILFLQIIIFLFITPGTPRIVIISYSMNYGVKNCVWTALGDVTANFIQATLVIFVIGSFFSDHPLFLNTFKSSILKITFNDFISDASLWIDTLKKDPRFSNLIVAGHSQGALVGLVASLKKKVDKFISISGAGRSIDQILLDQFNISFPMYADSTKMFFDSIKHGVYLKKSPLFLKQSF